MNEEQQKIKQYKFSFRTDKITYDRVKKLSEMNNETDSKTINRMVQEKLDDTEQKSIIMFKFIKDFSKIEDVCKALGHSHSTLNQLTRAFNILRKQDVVDYEKLVLVSKKISEQLEDVKEKQYAVEVALNRIASLKNR